MKEKQVLVLAIKTAIPFWLITFFIKLFNYNSLENLFIYSLVFLILWVIVYYLTYYALKMNCPEIYNCFLEKKIDLDKNMSNEESFGFKEMSGDDFSNLYNQISDNSPSQLRKDGMGNDAKEDKNSQNVKNQSEKLKMTENNEDGPMYYKGERMLDKNDFHHPPKDLAKAVSKILNKDES